MKIATIPKLSNFATSWLPEIERSVKPKIRIIIDKISIIGGDISKITIFPIKKGTKPQESNKFIM